jgi:hypothetical protein
MLEHGKLGPFTAIALAAGGLLLAQPGFATETPQIGGRAECSGYAGRIVGIQPRTGWTDPWFIVRAPLGSGTYDFKCVASDLRNVTAPSADQPQVDETTASKCKVGAKLEGLWGNNWYAVTVRAGPDAKGWCPVSFDGYGSMWDAPVPELRPRGSGPITRPSNPVSRETAETNRTARTPPDGRYRCSKIAGGGGAYVSMGTYTIKSGKVVGSPFPKGWQVLSVNSAPVANAPRNRIEIRYRSASGLTDVMECIP